MREFQLASAMREEGNVPGALSHLERAIELDPENGRAHVLLGIMYMDRSDYGQAETHLREGVRVLAEQPSMGSALAEARNILGVVLIHRESLDDAIALLTSSASDMLNHAPWYAWGNLGWAYYEKGDYDESRQALEQAVESQPRFCLGWYRLGQTLFAMERFEDAEGALTKAVEVDERCEAYYQDAYRLRGEVRARLGDRDGAIADFERCVELVERSEAGLECRRFLDSN